MSRAAVRTLGHGMPLAAALEREPARPASASERLAASAAGRAGVAWGRLGALWRRLAAARVVRDAARLAASDEASFDAALVAARAAVRRNGPQGAALHAALIVAAAASARTLGLVPHAVQAMAAREIVRGRVVEMATGEGKSLTAALAAGVLGLAGVPVDVITVNDYLAGRDAEQLAPLYMRLGLTVAAIARGDEPEARRAAYAADVVHVAHQDLVFDHLRHRSAGTRGPFAGRGLFFAIVDEADGILIDEARTPLILASEGGTDAAAALAHALQAARALLPGVHFRLDRLQRRGRLTAEGRRRLRAEGLERAGHASLAFERAEQALAALYLMQADRDYMVADGRVHIVDESTGRVLPDRSWQQGLHQLVELKEGLATTAPRETLARTTYPQFFARYLGLAGMSGTVAEVAGELRRHYGVQVVRIPTHRPVRRRCHVPVVWADAGLRWQAAVRATLDGLAAGQAVLVGTRSVAASEHLSRLLAERGVAHRVLNARDESAEAAIVAAAGRRGAVTVATNMAGRGTDITIDDTVRAAGGLRVVMTEHHETTRVDRQLHGRCARQGDPGEAFSLASLDDDLLRTHLPLAVHAMVLRWAQARGGRLPGWAGVGVLRWAQALASARQRGERDATLAYHAALRDELGFATEGG